MPAKRHSSQKKNCNQNTSLFVLGKKPIKDQNSHTVSYAERHYAAVASWVATYVFAFGTLVSAGYFITSQTKLAAILLLSSILLTSISTLLCYLVRCRCRCPLCRARPLVDGRSRKHTKAYRIKPLSYHSTSILNIMMMGCYRCQHCGTPFVLGDEKKKQKQEMKKIA